MNNGKFKTYPSSPAFSTMLNNFLSTKRAYHVPFFRLNSLSFPTDSGEKEGRKKKKENLLITVNLKIRGTAFSFSYFPLSHSEQKKKLISIYLNGVPFIFYSPPPPSLYLHLK